MDQPYSIFKFPERLDSWRKVLPYALLLSVSFALYGITAYFQFVWDDVVYVTRNFRIQGLSWPHIKSIWTGTYLGHYAPLHHTFLAILHHFSGMDPFGYHVGQLLVHAACVCLLYFVLQKIESPGIALLACLLFVVHPANIETVAWISETKSTLAFFFFLLSFWTYLRWRESERWTVLILCGIFYILSMLSKINTVVAPAIFLLYEYREGMAFHWKRITGLISLFLISGFFVVVHLASFHGSQNAMESSYYGGLGVHIQNLPFLLFFYLRMTVYPHPLSAWHMFRIYDTFTWEVAAAWIVLVGVAWILYHSNRYIQFWALWFLVFLAPVLQIIPFPIWVADRYLYIPAIGLFVLGSRLFFWVAEGLLRRWERWSWDLAMIVILLAYAWHTQSHLPVWRDQLSFWESTAQTCPTSPYCHFNLGLALLQSGHTEPGVKELIRAIEIRPDPWYLVYLGDAYTLNLRDYRQALIAYNMALAQTGGNMEAEVYAKLARAYILAGRFDEADRAIQVGLRKNAAEPALWVVNGFLKWDQGNREEARKSLEKAVTISGQTSNAAGLIYRYWGSTAEMGPLLSDLRSHEAGEH